NVLSLLVAAGTFAAFLHGRTRHGAVRAEHAAVARQRFQPLAAAFTDVEELARVRWHLLSALVAAARTGQDGFKLHRDSRIILTAADQSYSIWPTRSKAAGTTHHDLSRRTPAPHRFRRSLARRRNLAIAGGDRRAGQDDRR